MSTLLTIEVPDETLADELRRRLRAERGRRVARGIDAVRIHVDGSTYTLHAPPP